MSLLRIVHYFAAAMAVFIHPTLALPAEFTISSSPSNSVFSSVSDGQPEAITDRGKVTAKADGNISSMCAPYGRKSSARATADVAYSDQSPEGMFMELSAAAFAAGGHYRTCGFCGPSNQCVVITGHDTSARSDATASSVTKIEFGQTLNHTSFVIGVSVSGGADAMTMMLKMPDGETKPLAVEQATAIEIEAKEGDVYFLEVRTRVEASNAGGCCESRSEHSSGVKVTVTPAPIIASDEELQPFIIGGTPVDDGLYDSVVGVLIDGKIHCSGAVIGAKTVLTAAHCIDGYETAIAQGRVQLFLGNSIFEPGAQKAVVGSVFPKGEGGVRYRRTKTSIMHDVGLLYSAEAIGAPIAATHALVPSWSDIKKKFHSELTFVGYGLKVLKDGKGSGAGVKREATWRYSDLDAWNFYFRGQSSSTCSGDSGGPAFIRDTATGELTLVGVTSAGDSDCTRGIEMRVDAHRNWIEGRVK